MMMSKRPVAARKLDIVLRSATRLKKVINGSRMAAYAVAWIVPSVRVPSPKDSRHGRNPVWDTTISMTLDVERVLSGSAAAGSTPRLHIELLGQGLVSTKPIGFVSVDMTDILLQGSSGGAVRATFPEHPVRRRSGRQQGILNFELCLQASPTHSTSPAVLVRQPSEELPGFGPAKVVPTSSSAPNFLSQHQLRESGAESQGCRRDQLLNGSRNYVSGMYGRDIEAEAMGYGFAPVPNSPRLVDVGDHEEISLLDSLHRAPLAVSH